MTKLFVIEPGTELMVHFAEQTEDRWKAVSVLAPLEVRSAIRRREVSGDIAPDDALLAYALLEQDSRRLVQQVLTSQVVETAAALIETHSLRALDAIQLASAVVFRDSLAAADTVRFVASDRKLLAAASSEAFTAWDPAATG